MKASLRNLYILPVLIAGLAQTGRAAVTFSVTPAAVSNSYNGTITLQIGGLTNRETVVIQKYLDVNTNGVIDANDLMVQQFQLTVGQTGAIVIGGVTNVNVPFNSNTNTNAITVTWNFQQGPATLKTLAGQYLFEVSSPTGQRTNSFTVTNFSAQKFTGTVVSNGVPVPNAVVLLFQFEDVVGGAVANNSGLYTVQAPVGTYTLVAVKGNFVANRTAAANLVLTNGQTLTTNLSLIATTESISGKIIDATTGIGLPGVAVPVFSTDNVLLGVGFTDSNGNFSAGVTSSQWNIGGNDALVGLLGYVGLYNGVAVNTTTGSVSGLNIALPKATALFYGYVKDNSGNPLPGVQIESKDCGDLYDTDGYTDANGYYVSGAVGGLGSGDPYPVNVAFPNSFTNYLFSQSWFTCQNGGTNLSAGQAVLANFTAILATNYITGSLKDNNGNPIVGVEIYDYDETPINGLYYYPGSGGITDVNGNYSLNVANGTWDVGVDSYGDNYSLPDNYLVPMDQYPVISNNNAVVDFTAMLIYTFTNNNGTFTYAINNGAITITAYSGSGGAVTIPSTIYVPYLTDYLPVISIGDYAFFDCTSLTSVTIPGSITTIGTNAFLFCLSLTGVYCQGNAPSADSSVFSGDNSATVYCLPGSTGWSSPFGGLPTALWFLPNPLILDNSHSFGVQTNRFGFIISWATNIPVVVEACTNLANPAWQPVATNTLINGWSYFSDPKWTNYHSRIYRLHSALTVLGPPSVTLQPTNNSVTVPVGSNVTFAVSVSGTGPFSYQWQFNGTNLPNGIITTVAGGGTNGLGDGGAATSAELSWPSSVAVDATGSLFIADFGSNRVRKVGTSGIINTVAGNGTPDYSGDGGVATNAELYGPGGVVVDATGNLFITDNDNSRVRKVGTNGIINTVAGNGTFGYSGDGHAATNAALDYPSGVAVGATGNLFITDRDNDCIRTVGTNGIITTMAGGALLRPDGVAVDAAGNLFIADTDNSRIRKVGTNGIINTVAGNGTPGYSGDGGAATNAALNHPSGVTVDATGNLFIADKVNSRVRKVGTNGIINTVAGNGTQGCSGDGGAATNAALNYSSGVAVDANGNLFIADYGNNRIRKVVFNSSVVGPTLVLNNVGFGNAGAYDVVVSSPYGSVTSSVVNLTITLPGLLSAPQITVGKTNFTFLLSGPAGSNYVLQVSTNLTYWSSVSTSTIPVSGSITLSNAISGYNRRFYRVHLK